MLRAVSRHLTNTPESVCCSVSRSESALRCLLVLYHPPLNSAFTLLQRCAPSVCPAEAVALSDTPHYRILHIILVFLIALCGSFQSRSVDLGLSWLPWVSRESNSCWRAEHSVTALICREPRSYPGTLLLFGKKRHQNPIVLLR